MFADGARDDRAATSTLHGAATEVGADRRRCAACLGHVMAKAEGK